MPEFWNGERSDTRFSSSARMWACLTCALASVGSLARIALAQPSKVPTVVPVREMTVAERSPEVFANIFNVRQIANGQVLVNDGIRRQLLMLDSKLAVSRVVLDSTTSTTGERYGGVAAPIIAYPGDSTLFVDTESNALLLIDPNGKVMRTMSPPFTRRTDLRYLSASTSATDQQGNLLYRMITQTPRRRIGDTTSRVIIEESRQPDSASILRASFDKRIVDTIGAVRQVGGMRTVRTQSPSAPTTMVLYISPIETLDDWAVLSDGTIAFVRGHDYHIDFIRPNGVRESSAKLPFDWKRLSDEDKQHIIDSSRTALNVVLTAAVTSGGNVAANDALRDVALSPLTLLQGAAPTPSRPARVSAPGQPQEPLLVWQYVPIKEIPDYYPPIRQGVSKPDADGNLWILPTTSAQSKAGELVYDVVSNSGVLTHRVRLPIGRSIAGFGRNGVVYLMHRDAAGWHLERSRVIVPK